MKVQADLLEAKHWIYPLNRPKRDYQYNIVKHALFDNTLVALPTGLGKTFIAGAVMLNCMCLFSLSFTVNSHFYALRLPLVPRRKSSFRCSYQTARCPTDQCVPWNLWNSRERRHRNEWWYAGLDSVQIREDIICNSMAVSLRFGLVARETGVLHDSPNSRKRFSERELRCSGYRVICCW